MPASSFLTRRPDASTAVVAVVGALGSVLVARASYVAGTLPGHLDRAAGTGGYRWLFEAGVALLVLSWIVIGRLALDPSVPGVARRVCWVGAAMAAPLLLAAPVTSQDVWAYLGQANVSAHGLDPYSVGPGAVPGPFAHAVAHEWVATPSPYGPLWIWVCRLVVEIVGPHPWAGMFLLRIVAVGGVGGIAVALTALCRATGQRREVALWLCVAGPFPLLMLLAAVHNEAVMLALLVGGVAVAASVRRVWTAILVGAVLVGMAAAIKVTAIVVLPFLPLVWHRYAARVTDADAPAEPPTWSLWLRTAAASAAAGVVTLLLCGVLFGYGVGWVPQVGDGAVGVHWLSAPQQVADLVHLIDPRDVSKAQGPRYWLVHPLGLAMTAASLAAVALTARRRAPLHTLAAVLVLLVVTSPAPRLWYLLWPLAFVAADRLSSRLLVSVAAASATLALWFPPAVQPQPSLGVLLGLLLPLAGLIGLVLRDVPDPRASATDSSNEPAGLPG